MGQTMWRNGLLLGGALILAGPSRADPQSHVLLVRVSDVRVAQGVVHVDVCTEAQFLKSCSWSGSAPAVKSTTVVAIANLPPGVYAAQVFHDKNGNGKVDRMLFGIPTEGVGFSNDAKIKFAPPKFADAAFRYNGGAEKIELKLRYF